MLCIANKSNEIIVRLKGEGFSVYLVFFKLVNTGKSAKTKSLYKSSKVL
jgi:hypothetical protein